MEDNIAKHYNTISENYRFFRNDIYSQLENKVIGRIIKENLRGFEPKTIGDFGCGQGLPREIFDFFCKYFFYEGFDLASEMLSIAREYYSKEINEGKIKFYQGNLVHTLKQKPDNSYDLTFLLHGVFSYLQEKDIPAIIPNLARVTTKYTVISCFSQYAAIRPKYPKYFNHKDRQLNSKAGLPVVAYTPEEMEAILESYFNVKSIVGMNIKGGNTTLHSYYSSKQRELEKMKNEGKDITKAWQALEYVIKETLEDDLVIGKKYPWLGHDMLIIAKKK